MWADTTLPKHDMHVSYWHVYQMYLCKYGRRTANRMMLQFVQDISGVVR